MTVRTARRGGRDVAVLRCREKPPEWIVECDVYPVTHERAARLSCGPYSFASRAEAESFLDEATRALAALGCELS